MSDERKYPSDEELTAFLDGELSPDEARRIEALIAADGGVAERVEFLSRGSLPFDQAFAPLLAAAPHDDLQAMLAKLSPLPEARPARFGRRAFLGALAASLVAGIVVDRSYIGLRRHLDRDESSEWRAVVAEYIDLYTADTLSGPVPGIETQAAELAIIRDKLGLSLSPASVALSGVEFKRALVLQYDGKPLAQIAYLDPETGPLALCIVRTDEGAQPLRMEGRKGMNVVYWSSSSHAFMLIGHASPERMREIAGDVENRVAA